MFKFPNFLFAPTDAPAGGAPPITNEGLSKEDAIKFFEDDTDEEVEPIVLDKPVKDGDGKRQSKDDSTDSEEIESKNDSEEDDEEVDELEELEEELKEPTEEDLELVTPVRRKEILAKYPKLFKDFPYLEKAYYREQQFTEVFPTIEDAKTAQQKASALDGFEQTLREGNVKSILEVVSKHDQNAFHKMVDGYLEALLDVNEKAGYHVIGSVIKDTIVGMVRAGRASKDNELIQAAKALNKFMFATEEFEPKTRLATDEPADKPENKIAERERELTERQFKQVSKDLETRVQNSLTKTIELNIDPKDSMTPFVKKSATREALETVNEMIEKDSRFKAILDKLWGQVIKGDFKQQDINRVKEAYTSKAKTLLPSVIKKARQEALKGVGRKAKEEPTEETEQEETSPRPKKNSRESTPSSNRGQDDREKARKIPANVSTRDYLMQD